MRQSKDCTLHLLPLVIKGVRGLGKHPPVISSAGRSTEKMETYQNVVMTVLPCIKKTGTLALNLRIENDQSAVKDHGNPVFVNYSKRRSRRTHRSLRTEPISTEAFCVKTKRGM